ncbi:MAG: hypothetical protein PVI69_07790 [Desulfobacterales bacterium]|jgi:hypothetical protein
MKRHVKIRSKLFQNDWDALLVKEPVSGRLYVQTFQRSFSPKDVAAMRSRIQVAGCGPIYDDFMAQVAEHRHSERTCQIIKFRSHHKGGESIYT